MSWSHLTVFSHYSMGIAFYLYPHPAYAGWINCQLSWCIYNDSCLYHLSSAGEWCLWLYVLNRLSSTIQFYRLHLSHIQICILYFIFKLCYVIIWCWTIDTCIIIFILNFLQNWYSRNIIAFSWLMIFHAPHKRFSHLRFVCWLIHI